jgi:hypothetical protein
MTRAKDISKITTDANFGGTLDVTGTVTAGDLDLSVDTAGDGIQITSTGANYLNIGLDTNRTGSSQTLSQIEQKWDGTNVARLNFVTGTDTTNKDDGEIRLQTASAGTPLNRLRIESNGDISFYEDTGTTPKFFWDASNESLAVGTTSVFNSKITTASANGTAYGSASQLRISSGGVNNNRASIVFSDDALSDGKISYYPAALEADRSFSISARLNEADFVVKGSGNVGIGTSSPLRQLSISNASNTEISFISGTSSNASILFGDGITGTDVYRGYIQYQHSIDAMLFATSVAEAMRIDSSGNVGIGNSASGFNAGANNLVVGTGSGSEGITIYADNSSNSAVFFADPDSVTTGQINYQHASNAFTFHTNGGIERMRIPTSDSRSVLSIGDTAVYTGIISTAATNSSLISMNSGGGSEIVLSHHDALSTSGLGNVTFNRGSAQLGSIGSACDGATDSGNLKFWTTPSGGSLTERMRIDSSGNVTLPNDASDFTFNTNSLHIGASADIKIGHTSNNNGILSDNGMPFTIFTDVFRVNSADNSENLFGADKNSSFFAKFDNSTKIKTVSNGIEVTGGVYLGGTGSANFLDDYEEGTYEPTFTGSSAGTLTLQTTHRTLAYTKIGRQVTITGRIRNAASGTISGALQISLPFATASLTQEADIFSGSVLVRDLDVPTNTFDLNVLGEGGTSVIEVYASIDNGVWHDIDANDSPQNAYYVFGFSYFTDS